MQQNQQSRRFESTAPQQPIYRFPHNQPAQGWQPQQTFPPVQSSAAPKLSRRDQRALNRRHKKRRRIFTWWNLFAVIGIFTVIVQLARFVIIPLLVYLNVLAGGTL